MSNDTDMPDIEWQPEEPVTAVAVRQPTPIPIEAAATSQEKRVVEVTTALEPAYAKASTLEMTEQEIAALMEPFPDELIEIRPHDGLIYIPHIHISNRLSKIFKPGKWSMIKRRDWFDPDTSTMYGEYVLVIRGCYVGESIGGHPYVAKNAKTNLSDALESTAAEALRRIAGKRLSCGSQVWEPAYARAWVAKNAYQQNGKWNRRESPQSAPASRPPSMPAQASKAAVAPSAATKPPVSTTPLPATAEQRTRFIAMIGPDHHQTAFKYFLGISALLDTESLDDVPLGFVPSTKARANELMAAISAYGSSGIAEKLPWMNPVAPIAPMPPKPKLAPPTPKPEPEPVEVPRDKPGADAPDEWFMDIMVTVPHKGQKRDEYLKNPDTIGSLYMATKGGDQEAQKQLFGFVGHYEPKGWTNREGKDMPPNAADLKFREALDAFSEWHEAKDEDNDQLAF